MGKETQKHSSRTCKSKELLQIPAYQVGKPLGLNGGVEFRLCLESAGLGIPGCLFARKQAGYKCQEFPFAWISHTGSATKLGSSSFLADVSHHLQRGDCRKKGQHCTAQHPDNTVSAAGWKNTFPGGCLGYEESSFLIPCSLSLTRALHTTWVCGLPGQPFCSALSSGRSRMSV